MGIFVNNYDISDWRVKDFTMKIHVHENIILKLQ